MKYIHFLYVVGPKSPRFGLIYYLSMKSFLIKNPNTTLILHTNKEPLYSAWYQRFCLQAAERFRINIIKESTLDILESFGLKDFTHKADYLRLNFLKQYGGIYSDLDNICLKNIEHIFKYTKPAYSVELEMNHAFGSISNGLMFHPKGSKWTQEMLDLYDNYDPEDPWVETSIIKPTEIYLKDTSRIIELPAGFIDPVMWIWRDRQELFMHNKVRFEDSWVLHLCESHSSDYFKYIDLEHIMTIDTSFTYYVRDLLQEYWDYENNKALISVYE